MRRFVAVGLIVSLLPYGGLADGPACCAPVVRSVSHPTPVVVQSAATPSIYILNQVPAVPQGTTAYTASGYPNLHLIDVNRLAAQALALQQASVEAQSKYRSETLDFVAKLVEIQRPIAEQIAKGQAAAEVLREAGLSDGTAGPDELSTSSTPSLAQTHCAKCHTGDAAKAGFRLDQEFDAGLAVSMVAAEKMPPESDLSPSDRLLLIGELLESVTATE